MPGRWPPELVRQLQSALVTRREMMDWARCIVEDFHGDSIDARWNTVLGAGASITLEADSPSRITLATGATINTNAILDENAFRHWSVADRMTVRVRAKMSSTANILHRPILLDFDASNRIEIIYNTSAGHAGWVLSTTSAGVATVSASLLTADTAWHNFELSIQTGSVKARVDRGTVIENTANIPTQNLQIRTLVTNNVAANKTSEVDLIMLWPGLAIF